MAADPVRTLAALVESTIGQLRPGGSGGGAAGATGAIGVACSGGIDSMALADAAIDAARAAGRAVVVVTVDHRLSPGSAAVADGVAAWARGRGAIADVRAVDVERRASLEAAARDARYAALGDAIAAHGLAAMLLGHTARDQAETVLMRIVRGTGPAGLAGMPARRGPFVRPLLALPRAATEAYVAARALPTWDDPMNADAALARVRVRERIVPVLRAENPALEDALVRLAAASREWLDAIDALAEPFARFPIDCAALVARPPAIRKRALARALDAAGLGYDAGHLDQLDAVACAPARGEVGLDLPGGRVLRSYDRLAPASVEATGAANERSFRGATEAPECAPPGYAFRAWQPGDRMRPARLAGHSRKLSDLYGEAKVPRQLRPRARVLVRVDDGIIVWAEHVGVAFGEPPDLLPV